MVPLNEFSDAPVILLRFLFLILLTLKAPNKNCSRRHFIFFTWNKAGCFMWILCLAHDISSLIFSEKQCKNKKNTNVVCCSRDWRFKGKAKFTRAMFVCHRNDNKEFSDGSVLFIVVAFPRIIIIMIMMMIIILLLSLIIDFWQTSYCFGCRFSQIVMTLNNKYSLHTVMSLSIRTPKNYIFFRFLV